MTKRNMKKLAASVALAGAAFAPVGSAHAFFGGGADIATEHTQVASWAAQYIQMIEQYQQLVATYNSLNGARGFHRLVNNPEIRKYLPEDYANILNQGYGNWQELRRILDDPIGTKNVYKNRRDQLAIDEAMVQEAYRQASKRIRDIQVLLDKLRDTSDAKDVSDLQARIQAEQAMIQNERVKLAMLTDLQNVQQRKFAQQARVNTIKSLGIDSKATQLDELNQRMGINTTPPGQ